MIHPGRLTSFNEEQNGVTLNFANLAARVYLLSATCVRIRATFDDLSPERTYAFQKTVWSDLTDPIFPDRTKSQPPAFNVEDTNDHLILSTVDLIIKFNKNDWGLEVGKPSGEIVHKDLVGKTLYLDANNRINHAFVRSDNDAWFGLGEKTGPLDKTGRRYRMENTDAVGYAPDSADPLYKHIPFLIRAASNNTFTGMYYNNAWPSEFDLGCTRSGYWGEYASARFDGGEFDLTILSEGSIIDVVTSFTELTGRPPLMPRYSMGYLGSTMYYTELPTRSDLAVQSFIDKCNRENIPVSGFHLSSGYTTGDDGKRYAFNWNEARFPNPDAFVASFSNQALALSPNIKPGILESHPDFSALEKENAFIRNTVGDIHLEQFWGGQAGLVDFTCNEGRDAWKKRLTSALVSKGIYSIWNDNNEFEFADTSAFCHGDGQKENVNGMRPILSNMMAKVAYDAVREEHPNIRPFILSRAGFAGLQKWAHTWSGDNGSSWEYLRSNITTMLGVSLSGVAFNGMDIGGFTGPAPQAELFLRWIQNGVFHPRFCIHSANDDNTVSEPWMHESVKAFVVNAMQFRYKLLPYLYQQAFHAHTNGTPICAPLLYHFWDDERCRNENLDFMLGDACFVPAVLHEGQREKLQYFPEGEQFVCYKTGEWFLGGEHVQLQTPLDSVLWFLRANYWLVLSRETKNDAFEFIATLTPSKFKFYWDDGQTFNYQRSESLTIDFKLTEDSENFQLKWETNGQLTDWTQSHVEFKLFSKRGCPMGMKINQDVIPQILYKDEWESQAEGFWFDHDKQCINIKLKAERLNKSNTLSLNFINMIAVSI